MNEYDDPYVMLAHYLISSHTKAELERILVDDDFIYKMIIKEVRHQDFSGAFLDCIVQSILDNKERMEMCGHLDALSRYFFAKLDLPRLRKDVRHYAEVYGLI